MKPTYLAAAVILVIFVTLCYMNRYQVIREGSTPMRLNRFTGKTEVFRYARGWVSYFGRPDPVPVPTP